MATYTWDGSVCLQSVIDQIRNNPDPNGDVLDFDASAFAPGVAVKGTDNPCGHGGETPPTWDGSGCTGYGGSVMNLSGISGLTINGNGVRIVGSNTSNWVVGIHNTNNVTINDLFVMGVNNVNQDANGVIFGTQQGGTWTDSNGQTVNFNGVGNYAITLNNVVTEASAWHLGGIQSLGSSTEWYINNSRFTGIAGQDLAGAYSTNGGSGINFHSPTTQFGGAERFVFCNNEVDCHGQYGNSTGINQGIITDGNAIIVESNNLGWGGDVWISGLYAHDIGAEIINLFRMTGIRVHVCHVTAKRFGYYVGQNSPNNFTPPPLATNGHFISNANWQPDGSNPPTGTTLNLCNILVDRDGVGANDGVIGSSTTGGLGDWANVYAYGGFQGWGFGGLPAGDSTLEGGTPPGGITDPNDETLCTDTTNVVCGACSSSPCNTNVDICGDPFECGEIGAFSAIELLCEPFTLSPAGGATVTVCEGESGQQTIGVVPSDADVTYSATGTSGITVLSQGPNVTFTATQSGTVTVVVACEDESETFTITVVVEDCNTVGDICTDRNHGVLCDDVPFTFTLPTAGSNYTITATDGPGTFTLTPAGVLTVNPTGVGAFSYGYEVTVDGGTGFCTGVGVFQDCTGTSQCDRLVGCAG